MQSTTLFNPSKIISELEKSKSSGCLEVEEGLVSWKIYLHQGQLKYVYCSAQLIDQLAYYLHSLDLKQTASALRKLPAPYLKIQSSILEKSSEQNIYCKVISWLLAENYLNAPKGLKLVELITKDAFESYLWLTEGTYSWKDGENIPLWISQQLGDCFSLNISQQIQLSKVRLQQWQECSVLFSYHQRPYFSSGWEIKSLPASGMLSQQNLKELANIIKGRTSIRQLSVLLKKDELRVAQILSPYIEQKIIYLRDAPSPLDQLPNIPSSSKKTQNILSTTPSTVSNKEETSEKNNQVKTWKIVCIDDSPTILKEIQRFLSQDKFDVTAIDDPIEAVPTIFRLKPDLILLDITMPKINGYKLCSLLRGSKNCDQIPIIMVTGNTGFIDKARAKIAGATDYFTKPFTKEGLTQIVEKYLQ